MSKHVPAWSQDPAVRQVITALAAAGGEGRFVGGCVRDSLLGRDIKDIDIATPLQPDAVMAALRSAGLSAIPTGLKHGTVTALVDHRPFEITTLREDLETDGRHARVGFTTDWRRDAQRRDLTMNALFLDSEDQLYDYVDGKADLEAGRVRFVGDPRLRIQEDFLRILRFFRFHAHYGRGDPDGPALQAAKDLASGLRRISAERKAQEMLRLLQAPDPLPVLRTMDDRGILAFVLPKSDGCGRLERLLREVPESDAVQRLAALVSPGGGQETARALKLSKRQSRRLNAMTETAGGGLAEPLARRRLLYFHGPEALLDRARIAVAAETIAPAFLAAIDAEVAAWQPKALPITGSDLLALGLEGPAIGQMMRALEAWWIEADFQPDHDALLAEVKRRLPS